MAEGDPDDVQNEVLMSALSSTISIPSTLTGTCDTGCNARALVLVSKPEFGDLAFCGHHYHDFEIKLILGGFQISVDDRKSIQ